MGNIEDIAAKRREYIRSRKELRFFERIELDLGDARDKEEHQISGDSVLVESIDGEVDLYFNEPESDYVELDKTRKMYMDYWRIFITNAAQADKTCTILVGRQGTFDGFADVATLTNQLEIIALLDIYRMDEFDAAAEVSGLSGTVAIETHASVIVVPAGEMWVLDSVTYIRSVDHEDASGDITTWLIIRTGGADYSSDLCSEIAVNAGSYTRVETTEEVGLTLPAGTYDVREWCYEFGTGTARAQLRTATLMFRRFTL